MACLSEQVSHLARPAVKFFVTFQEFVNCFQQRFMCAVLRKLADISLRRRSLPEAGYSSRSEDGRESFEPHR